MNIATKPLHPSFSLEGRTIAGGINQKAEPVKLPHPTDISIDRNEILYIVDYDRHAVLARKANSTPSELNSRENRLYYPTTLVIDEKNNSLIIADKGHKRVVRWPRRNAALEEVLIADISCWGLALDQNDYLYVSDDLQHVVKRYKLGESEGSIVAGRKDADGAGLNQFNKPRQLFVDEDESIYVSDHGNHRVMKWMRGAKEGVVVAGGHGSGESLRQLHSPNGIFVDQLGTVYVADTKNHRVVRWLRGATEGQVVVGGNGAGSRPSQLDEPTDLVFDRQNNLYVIDQKNHRIQFFFAK